MKALLLMVLVSLSTSLRAQSFSNPMGRTDHVIAGAAVAISTHLAAELLFPKATQKETRLFAKRIGLISVFSAAIGKEIYDYAKHKSDNSWNAATLSDGYGDFITTCLSGMTVSVLIPF